MEYLRKWKPIRNPVHWMWNVNSRFVVVRTGDDYMSPSWSPPLGSSSLRKKFSSQFGSSFLIWFQTNLSVASHLVRRTITRSMRLFSFWPVSPSETSSTNLPASSNHDIVELLSFDLGLLALFSVRLLFSPSLATLVNSEQIHSNCKII